MKKIIFISAIIICAISGKAQNPVMLSYEKFQTWANSGSVKDFMMIETENKSNVMSVVFYRKPEKKTLTVLCGFQERFYDFRLFKEYANAEIYELNGHKAVFYTSTTDTFLNVEFADWNLSTTWMVNNVIAKEEIEKLYMESGFDAIKIQD